MKIAGKHGIGALSIASTSLEGLQALPTQWSFAEEAAAQNGKTVNRKNWRVLMSWHIAESKKQAEEEAKLGLQRWHNEYNVRVLGRPDAKHVDDPEELLELFGGRGSAGAGIGVIGTPVELVAAIRKLQEVTGGFGVVLGFAHDWANREATLRSWELVARYVVPEINGYFRNQVSSAEFLVEHQKELMAGAGAAIMAKIAADPRAAEAMKVTMQRAQERDGGWRPGVTPVESEAAVEETTHTGS
jgi:limonene 1,2-monooxygenase